MTEIEILQGLRNAHINDTYNGRRLSEVITHAIEALREKQEREHGKHADILKDCLTRIIEPSESFEVKPCPFCGSENIAYWQYETKVGLRWRVVCRDCLAMIDPGWVQQHGYLAEMWNKRINENESLWISVNDRLPECGEYGEEYVLVCMDDEFIATTAYVKNEGFELWAESGEVTHWMPLPKPPKEGK